MLNTQTVIISCEGLTALVRVEETFNNHTGDVDQHLNAEFYSRNGNAISCAELFISGNKVRCLGDNKLAKKFQLLS